jgi:hypothetical protein
MEATAPPFYYENWNIAWKSMVAGIEKFPRGLAQMKYKVKPHKMTKCLGFPGDYWIPHSPTTTPQAGGRGNKKNV